MRIGTIILATALVAALPSVALAHCQVPCGIYDDAMRIATIEEHIVTIERAMERITALSSESERNDNQIVRWVVTKEAHAQEVQDIVAEYFMTQRIKPAPAEDGEAVAVYREQLELLHHMLVYAMKCKQGVDTEAAAGLREATRAFRLSYLGEEEPHQH